MRAEMRCWQGYLFHDGREGIVRAVRTENFLVGGGRGRKSLDKKG